MSKKKYSSIEEFYPFYLSQHRHRANRYLHIYGTCLGVLAALSWLLQGKLLLMPLALLIGYGFSWTGHFLYEKNRPATFEYPLMSFACDFLMLKDFFTGKLEQKVKANLFDQ